MMTIPKSDWRRALYQTGGGAFIAVVCPSCRREAAIGRHVIASDGAVLPSLSCPNQVCDFQGLVILEGWKQ